MSQIELDTSYFLGNAPATASLTGWGPDGEVSLLTDEPCERGRHQ